MSQALKALLKTYSDNAKGMREKGDYFEYLGQDFLKNDPVYAQQFTDVWTYAEWAEQQDVVKRDTGIDLVAKNADDEGYTAIQCKFYDEYYKIKKSDVDSFFAASGKAPFTRRIILDTTRKEWSENIDLAIEGQHTSVTRIGLRDLEQSPIDWGQYAQNKQVKLKSKKTLRPHQKKALEDVKSGLADADRGKMIMACGTGKTYTSLKIAEELAGQGKRVLYLVPSLSLMSQTVREWSNDTEVPLHSFAVCSDAQVGKRKAQDLSDLNAHDLAFPATTDAMKLAEKLSDGFLGNDAKNKMTVVFSTYQSIQVISDAQNKYGMAEFDLVICDEAHRTTGATLADEDESKFVMIHSQDNIKAKKRIYMTATPRIYGDAVKTKAKEADAVICSMDDVELYGEVLHEITFSEAVEQQLLTDYKVIVLAVDEETVSSSVQKRLSDENSELVLDDVTKIIGCYRALTKQDLRDDLKADSNPMKRAVAFCRDIKSSKLVVNEFSSVIDEYLEDQGKDDEQSLQCESKHVDGTFKAKEREALIDWLNNVDETDTCHILSNARCLSEGVDVPALDAIMFMHPRKSQIDVVQSVGRVMRRAEGKNLGYVILPIGVPAGLSTEEALNNNEKYQVVWQILNALRSHDDRMDSDINRADLGERMSRIEIIPVANTLPNRDIKTKDSSGIGQGGSAEDDRNGSGDSTQKLPKQTSFVFDEFSRAILAKIVKKCGTRDYWEDWANDIADIASKHISRIKGVLSKDGSKEREAFDAFLEEIRDDLNESITEDDAIEMLAQHLITKPVFDALFEGYSFAKSNPVSRAMQKVLDVLDEHSLEKESESLEKFYASVRRRAAGIETAHAKQQIIVQLYDKFFRNAFPRLTDKLGIVYTPVEVVDFIINSVNDVLKSEFGQTLGSKGVHILDPFTGTGTFITRLLQSGLIKQDELKNKYKNEIHANEIVLLAYYIAAINIEQVYHEIMGGEYQPFEGICLTDTFQLYEKEDMISRLLVDNSNRRIRQKELDIRVIIGNPPYSGGQDSANDQNTHVNYPYLDQRVAETYSAKSAASSTKDLINSYIRAIRWASDRIGNHGVLGFITGNAFIEKPFADGMRKCLEEEFSDLYIVNLRGDIRKDRFNKGSTIEGGNIFDSGSQSGISITFFVKNKDNQNFGNIYYKDIGKNLSTPQKKNILMEWTTYKNINDWTQIKSNEHSDWINQRDDSFYDFISIGDKKNKEDISLFENYALGINTNRDPWCYNSSKQSLSENISNFVKFYNSEVNRFINRPNKSIDAKEFISYDTSKIKWSSSLIPKLEKGIVGEHEDNKIRSAYYRPFTKQYLYFDKMFNHRISKFPEIFPNSNSNNKIIILSGVGSRNGLSVLISDVTADLNLVEGGAQCFPLYLYEKTVEKEADLLSSAYDKESVDGYRIKDGISDAGLEHFKKAYPNEKITKEDLFYYIYGLLHSPEYRERYADNLSKQLPRIPAVKKAEDFWVFSKAGRDLADLHLNYETVEPYAVTFKDGGLFMDDLRPEDYLVKKMKFGGKGKNKDKTTVVYNHKITMQNIPLEAYDYVVNGKPALEWVMDRQLVKTDKASGIVNDANDYANETVGDPAYPLKLFQRVITVSLETIKIVNALPDLDIDVSEKNKAEAA